VEYIINKYNICIKIPASNSGKYRFKKRGNRLDFGETFSTRKEAFDEQAYLEWQIGYDVPVKDVKKGEKTTKLTSKTFIGSNKKVKYPYELSELLYAAMEINLVSKEEIKSLINEIKGYKNFIDEKAISVEHHASITLNGIKFEETSIKLPTLFMIETLDETQIEISIQKQQYASGVQPMVYFCIPVRSFNNASTLLGKSSIAGDMFEYTINENNIKNLINLMKVFGMASKRHHHDVVQIISTLIGLIGY